MGTGGGDVFLLDVVHPLAGMHCDPCRALLPSLRHHSHQLGETKSVHSLLFVGVVNRRLLLLLLLVLLLGLLVPLVILLFLFIFPVVLAVALTAPAAPAIHMCGH